MLMAHTGWKRCCIVAATLATLARAPVDKHHAHTTHHVPRTVPLPSSPSAGPLLLLLVAQWYHPPASSTSSCLDWGAMRVLRHHPCHRNSEV